MKSEIIRRRLGVWCVGLGLSVLVAACGQRGSSATEFRDGVPLPKEPLVVDTAEIGTYGGRFVIGATSGPKTFNSMMANENSSTDITHLMFIGLADFDNGTQKDVPLLAKSWDLSPDNLTWTFHLREGAAFSDGHPITSDDVLFSFAVAYDPTLHPSIQDLLKTQGKNWEISALDPHTVVIKTVAPNALLLEAASSVYVLPKHVLEPAFKNGTFASANGVSTPPDKLVTSGPWRLAQYVPGEKTVLTRNPYWFGTDKANHRLPYLDQLVFLVVPDQDAADLKFRAGELDGLDDVKPENYKWYEDHQKDGGFTLFDLGPAMNCNFIWFNLNPVRKATPGKTLGEPVVGAVKYAWFNNPVFRRAVSMAIDRDALIPSVFYGTAVKNWSTMTPGNKLWYSPDIPHSDYNPQEAKRLLASLGWKDSNGDGVIEDTRGNPVSFTLKTNSSNQLRIAMANFIRDDLAKVGIKITLVPIDFNTFITNLRDDFQYEAGLLGLQTGVPPDPSMGQNTWRSSGSGHNWNIRQPKPETPQEARIDALMDAMIATTDYKTRKAAWDEVQTIVNEQNWLVWLPTLVTKLPVRNGFGNVQPTVIPHRLLWNIDRIFVKARTSSN